MNGPRVPVELVRGTDEVTVWLWANSADPVTVRFTYHEWAKIEKEAEKVANGDVGLVVGTLLENDLSKYLN